MSNDNVRELVEFCEEMNRALNDRDAEYGVMETIHEYEHVVANAAKILGVADSQPQDPLAFMPPLEWEFTSFNTVCTAQSALGEYSLEVGSDRVRVAGPSFQPRTELFPENYDPLAVLNDVAFEVSDHYNAIREAVREGRLLWLDADGAYTPADGLPGIPTVEMFAPLEWEDCTVGNGAVVRGVAAKTPLGTYRVQAVGGGDLMAFGGTLFYAQAVQSLEEGQHYVQEHYDQVKHDVLAGNRAFLIGKDGVWREGDAFLEPPAPASAPMVVDTAVPTDAPTNWLDEARRNYAIAEDVSDVEEMQLALSQAQASALISIAESLRGAERVTPHPRPSFLSQDTLEWLADLGNFALSETKGRFVMRGRAPFGGEEPGSVTWLMSADDWRDLACACNETAQFLDCQNMVEADS